MLTRITLLGMVALILTMSRLLFGVDGMEMAQGLVENEGSERNLQQQTELPARYADDLITEKELLELKLALILLEALRKEGVDEQPRRQLPIQLPTSTPTATTIAVLVAGVACVVFLPRLCKGQERQHVDPPPQLQQQRHHHAPDGQLALHNDQAAARRRHEAAQAEAWREIVRRAKRAEWLALLPNRPADEGGALGFQANLQRIIAENESLAEGRRRVPHRNVSSLFIHVLLNGVPSLALLDSAAERCCMNKDVLYRCNTRPGLWDPSQQGLASGVGVARRTGILHDVYLTIGNIVTPVEFSVFETTDVAFQLIIGFDMIKKLQMVIDLNTMNLTLVGGHSVTLLAEGEQQPFLMHTPTPPKPDELTPLPCQRIASTPLPFVSMRLNDVCVRALIDTGAQKSILSLDALKKCNMNQGINLQQRRQLQGAGNAQAVAEVNDVHADFAGHHMRVSMDVLPLFEGADLIVGMDILFRENAIIDLEHWKLRLNKGAQVLDILR